MAKPMPKTQMPRDPVQKHLDQVLPKEQPTKPPPVKK